MIRSIGTTSRGRLGLTSSALGAGAITQPWLTDPVDKEVLINGLQQIINAAKNGEYFYNLRINCTHIISKKSSQFIFDYS